MWKQNKISVLELFWVNRSKPFNCDITSKNTRETDQGEIPTSEK